VPRWTLAGLIALAAVLAATAAGGRATQTPRLGILLGDRSATLVRIDPSALRAREGRRLDVQWHTWAWSFSRDGRRLALGGDLHNRAVPSVLTVDTRTLRRLGRVNVARSGWLRATAWLPDGRLVAVTSDFDDGVRTDVVTINRTGRRVLHRQTLAGQPIRVARLRDGLVALLAPANAIRAARLAVVGRSGRAEVVVVDRIRAGSVQRSGGGAEFSQIEPALAVDGRRAFVVGAGDEVAVVDLATHAVAYHRTTPAYRRPLAAEKAIAGPSRVARWLGGGLLAVSGGDYSMSGESPRYDPIGLRLIDTRTWTVRDFGGGTDSILPAGDRLLATADVWSSELKLPRPPGLRVYGRDGRERLHLYDGERPWVMYADAVRALIRVDGRVDVVDLATGRVLEHRKSAPVPLVPPGAPAES
jgi:hypothetical protein